MPLLNNEAVLRLEEAFASYRTKDIVVPKPVFITIDDCGFYRVYPDNPKTPIVSYETYERLLNLSKKYHIKIALCFTTKYLDKDNVSGEGQPLPYLNKLMRLLTSNQDSLEIANHGWVHDQKNHAGEFYLMDVNRPASKEVQEESIRQSYLIYKSWGLKFPKIFTPPYNAFVPGVTDRILSKYGCKYVISTPYVRCDKHSKVRLEYASEMRPDTGVIFLPRKWLGIVAIDTFLRNIHSNLVKRELVSSKGFLFHKLSQLNHSYMTHIGNFLHNNYSFWDDIFTYIEKKPYSYLPKDVESATSQWLFLKYGSLSIKKADKRTILILDIRKMPSFYIPYLNHVTIKLRMEIDSAQLNDQGISCYKRGFFTYALIPMEKWRFRKVSLHTHK